MMKGKTYSTIFTSAIGALVVLGILIAVNALFANVRLRKDLTEERIYTLSGGTVNMLKGLDRNVTLKFYFTRDNPDVPMPLKNYAQRIIDLLNEVVSHSGGNVTLEIYDPEPDSDAEEWAQRYGLTGQATGMLGLHPNLYLGLVAVSGTKEASIPFLAPALEPQMEYLVIRLVQEVTQVSRSKLGIMSALPVMAPPASPYGPAPGQPQDWFFVSELKKQYEVQRIPMEAEQIPADINTLVLVHPKGISERTLYAIDQFLLKGGRLMAFVDPLCISEEVSRDEPMGGMPMLASDINTLSRAWGVEMPVDAIVADIDLATPVNLGNGRAERLPTWLTLRGGAHMDPDEIITGTLDSLMLPFAGAVKGAAAEGLTLTPLLFASKEAVTVNSFMARNPAALNTRSGTPAPVAALAVRLAGSFKTAFPAGQPAAEGEESPADTPDASLKESERDGVVVLIADVDMLANEFAVRALNFFGQTMYQPMNDNLNLTLNLAEQLSGNEALIGLRGRGSFNRPFDRVLAMEKEAQQRWQEEEEKLQQKLQDTQERINELQSAKNQDQQFILSPEQQQEIEKFRAQRFETQRQLKEVRKNLRHNIEQLGMNLKVINMAAVPALVALYGIGHWWVRRKRAA
ncbi:MAG: ABC transporter [Spartobacteria bacterium]|nr:ABC transporter [Spartobacteria bacterium]